MSEEPIKIFYSYSRKDLEMRNTLEDHLSALREAKRIETWHDLQLEAGTEWEPAILEKLDTADIILLLISSSFIASKYCYGTELKRAIARHDAGTARVIPIILRDCDWNHSYVPFSKLNVLPDHADSITSRKWKNKNEAFTVVAQRIRETVDHLKAEKQAERQAQEQKRKQRLAQQEAEEQADDPKLWLDESTLIRLSEDLFSHEASVEAKERQHQAELLNQQEAEAAERQRQQELEQQRMLKQQRVLKRQQELEQQQRRQTDRPLTRRQVLQWAIPAGVGVGVVGVSVASQLFTIDYSKLEGFLKAGQYKEADQETTNLMLKVGNREKEGFLDDTSLQNFPCEVLSKIDRLWVDSSEGKFGFSVQKKIYVENCSGKPDGQYDEKAWQCFGDQVGWRVKGQWISYEDVTFNTQAFQGHLPWSYGWVGGVRLGGVFWGVSSLAQRIVKCSTSHS